MFKEKNFKKIKIPSRYPDLNLLAFLSFANHTKRNHTMSSSSHLIKNLERFKAAQKALDAELRRNAELNAKLELKAHELESRAYELRCENEELESALKSLDSVSEAAAKDKSRESTGLAIENNDEELERIIDENFSADANKTPPPKPRSKMQSVIAKKKEQVTNPKPELSNAELHEQDLEEIISSLESDNLDDMNDEINNLMRHVS